MWRVFDHDRRDCDPDFRFLFVEDGVQRKLLEKYPWLARIVVDGQVYDWIRHPLLIWTIASLLGHRPTCPWKPKKVRVLVNRNLAQKYFSVVVRHNLYDQCLGCWPNCWLGLWKGTSGCENLLSACSLDNERADRKRARRLHDHFRKVQRFYCISAASAGS